jgi:uncharacterized membrane protein
MMKNLIKYFFQGLLFVVPAAVTFYVLIQAVVWMDSLLSISIPIHLPGSESLHIPGLGILIILVSITILGYIGTRFVRNPFFQMFESLMERAPLLKIIYSSVKDLIEAFVGEKKRFTQPVLVAISIEPSIQRIGFITHDNLLHLGLEKEKLAVYLPFSYGFNGQLVIVDAVNVKKLDVSGTEIMKFVISGGVTEI